jgi:hypothetical protein
LCYFPDSSADQSWVASVGTVLDGAALLLSAREYNTEEHAAEEIKGPMMVLAYGVPGLVRIGQSVGLPLDTPERLLGLLAKASEPAPSVSVEPADYRAALDRLHPLLAVPEAEQEACWRRYAWIRSGYDRALRGLAGLTPTPPAPWTTDRPARVGRPRLVMGTPIEVDWELGPTNRSAPSADSPPTGG